MSFGMQHTNTNQSTMPNFTIQKRDGLVEQFSLDKIMNAIIKAFDSVSEPVTLSTITAFSPNSPSTTASRSKRSRTRSRSR